MKDKNLDHLKFGLNQNKSGIIIIFCIVIGLLLFFTAVYKYSVLPASKRFSKVIENTVGDKPITPIVSSTEVAQTFTVHGNIIGFSLQLATYNRINKGILHVKLLDTQNNSLVYQKEMNLSNIQDNQFQDFIFNSPISNPNKKQYKIIVTTSGQPSPDNAITIWTSDKDSYIDGFCTINGNKQAGDLSFMVYSGDYRFIIPVYWSFAIIILAFFIFMAYLLSLKNLKIQYIFLISVLCLGLIYMFLMPPQSIPDEPAHYETAYRYSNGLMLYGYRTQNGNMLRRADDIVNIAKFTTQPKIEQYNIINQHILDMVNDSKLIETSGSSMKMGPTVYLPAAIGITIARILHLGSISLYYFGRLANLLFYTLTVFFAIKKIPFGKMILFVTALLPMSIHQAASYSYDAIVNGLAFLFIGYCLYAAFGKQNLERKDIITLCILGAFLAPAKMVYVCICFLCLLIPKERFSNIKVCGNKKVICIVLILVCSIAAFSINSASTLESRLKSTHIVPWNNEPGYTISYLLNNPGRTIEVLLHTLQDKSSFYLETMIGARLGWLEINVPSILIFLFVILLVLSVFKEEREEIYLNKKDKCLIFIIISCVFAFVCASMLLYWTPLSWNVIEGVQGRYFLPVLPLVLLIFRNSNIILKKNINNIIVSSTWLLQIMTIASVFQLIINR